MVRMHHIAPHFCIAFHETHFVKHNFNPRGLPFLCMGSKGILTALVTAKLFILTGSFSLHIYKVCDTQNQLPNCIIIAVAHCTY